MRPKSLLAALAVLAALGLSCPRGIAAAAGAKPSARLLAGPDGKLDLRRAALYIMLRDEIPLAKLVELQSFAPHLGGTPNEANIGFDSDKLVAAFADQLNDIEWKIGPAPWAWEKLDQAYPVEAQAGPKSEWPEIKGITKAHSWTDNSVKRSIGPIELRKNSDELGKPLKDAKGLSFGYSDNRLEDKPALWNSEGIAFLPIKYAPERKVGVSAEWKLAQNHEADKHDVEEATYSLPFTAYLYPESKASAVWAVQGKPYYQTDFSGGHQIRGAELAAEFVGYPLGNVAGQSSLYLGGFHNVPGETFQYQLRVIPKLNYSKVHKEGRHSTRKLGDSWLRLGAQISLDYRWSRKNPLDFGLSYETADDIRSEGGHGELWNAHATWWVNLNTGLTFQYQKGDTPIADAKVDLVTVGFEFKY